MFNEHKKNKGQNQTEHEETMNTVELHDGRTLNITTFVESIKANLAAQKEVEERVWALQSQLSDLRQQEKALLTDILAPWVSGQHLLSCGGEEAVKRVYNEAAANRAWNATHPNEQRGAF
jgi:hypothetical protein